MHALPKYLYNLNNDYYDPTSDYYQNRPSLTRELFKHYWPNHTAYWIENSSDLEDIEEKLERFRIQYRVKHFILVHTEEEWLYDNNIDALRQIIQNYKYWTDKSFVVTNSYKDYKITKRWIRALHRPGLLDLIAYKPYHLQETNSLLKLDNIKYHTGYIYKVPRPCREEVLDLLLDHTEKCSIINYKNNIYSNNAKDFFASKKDIPDAPFASITVDSGWTKPSAFHIALETLNNNSDLKIGKFAPTLSEKTFKAMHMYRPALIYGGLNTQESLKRLGFDTWDWLIDWSFDKEKKGNESFQMYLEELNRLLNTDIEKIKYLMKKNKKSLIHNKKQVVKLLNKYGANYGRNY